MTRQFDLNSDMGESFGWFKHGVDDDIIVSLTSANLACGFHAGDPSVMRRTVQLARDHGVAVGAHPGFPDLLGFGRRNLNATPAQVKDYVTYQVGALQAFCRVAGVPLQHVKPHGALYMMVLEDEALAEAVVEAVLELDDRLLLYTTGDTAAEAVARRKGLRVVREFFGDRPLHSSGWVMFGYDLKDAGGGTPEGIAQRVVQVVTQGKTVTTDGQTIDFEVDSVCIHSDTPGAAQFMKAVRQALETAGVDVRPAGTYL
jgi:UPF0271 protein